MFENGVVVLYRELYDSCTKSCAFVNICHSDMLLCDCAVQFLHVAVVLSGDIHRVFLCVAAACGNPGFPENGQTQFSTTTFNSVATYTCDSGYTLQGSNSRTCQASGQWSGSVPQCNRELKFWSTVTGLNWINTRNYHMDLNFRKTKLLRIVDFHVFHVFIFADAHLIILY